MSKHGAPIPVKIRISIARAFLLMLALATPYFTWNAFTLPFEVEMFGWPTTLMCLLGFMWFMSLVGAFLFRYVHDFTIIDNVLHRDVLGRRQTLATTRVVRLWNFWFSLYAWDDVEKRSFLIPGRVLLGRDAREELNDFALRHLKPSHRLFRYWAIGEARKKLAADGNGRKSAKQE